MTGVGPFDKFKQIAQDNSAYNANFVASTGMNTPVNDLDAMLAQIQSDVGATSQDSANYQVDDKMSKAEKVAMWTGLATTAVTLAPSVVGLVKQIKGKSAEKAAALAADPVASKTANVDKLMDKYAKKDSLSEGEKTKLASSISSLGADISAIGSQQATLTNEVTSLKEKSKSGFDTELTKLGKEATTMGEEKTTKVAEFDKKIKTAKEPDLKGIQAQEIIISEAEPKFNAIDIPKLEKNFSDAKAEVALNNQGIKDSQTKVNTFDKSLAKLKEPKAPKAPTDSNDQKQLAKYSEANANYKRELATYKQSKANLETQKAAAQEDVKSRTGKQETLNAAVTNTETTLTTGKTDKEALETKIKDAKAEIKRLKGDENTEGSVANLEAKKAAYIQDVDKKLADIATKKADIETEKTNAKTTLETKENNLKTLANQKIQLQAKYDQAKTFLGSKS